VCTSLPKITLDPTLLDYNGEVRNTHVTKARDEKNSCAALSSNNGLTRTRAKAMYIALQHHWTWTVHTPMRGLEHQVGLGFSPTLGHTIQRTTNVASTKSK